MGKWLGEIFRSLISGLFLLSGPILIAVFAYLKEVPPYTITLMILGAVGLSFFAVNQYLIFRTVRGRNLARLNKKKLEKIIREWVDIPGYAFKRERPEPELLFKFQITDPGERIIYLIRKSDSPGVLYFLATIVDVSLDERTAHKVSIELARLGIGYKLDVSKKKIWFTDTIALDEYLTVQSLRERIYLYSRAIILSVATIELISNEKENAP